MSNVVLSQTGMDQIPVQFQSDGTRELQPSLTLLQRAIEGQYRELPWPANLNNIVVLSNTFSGRSDIAFAAKVIGLMQSICPSLKFTWVIPGSQYNPKSHLFSSDLTPVSAMVYPYTMTETQADFVINLADSPINLHGKVHVVGPKLDLSSGQKASPQKMVLEGDLEVLYSKVHRMIFPSQGECHLEMGLQPGRGVFFDERAVNVSLSRGHCCPLYLFRLGDERLKKMIFTALDADRTQVLDYDKNSVNFGYAHKGSSWAKFIDFVAVHERTKDVTIVLNQTSDASYCKVSQFQEIFTGGRLDFLRKEGYSRISICDVSGKRVDFPGEHGRKLSIVLSPGFSPADMACLQFASERILATGRNTAAEAWASRCILYLYENSEPNKEFFNEQIAAGNQISEDLGKLLTLFDDNGPLPPEKMSEAIEILRKPSLEEDTLRLCHHITENYSFSKMLEGALKRAAWHHCLPELIDEEAAALDSEFKMCVLNGNGNSAQVINNMSLLAKRIQLKVRERLGVN